MALRVVNSDNALEVLGIPFTRLREWNDWTGPALTPAEKERVDAFFATGRVIGRLCGGAYVAGSHADVEQAVIQSMAMAVGGNENG